jgi:GT2 family glycosyltransferase
MKPAQRPQPTPLVSIVIPVFNKCDLTVQCLHTLAKVTSHIPHEVIVVDNASTDATPREMAKQPHPVRYLRNETNRNFAGACNQGAAAANGRYLAFLNNDTIPLQGWLDALIDDLRTHPEVAMVGSRLLYESGLVQHAGIAFGRESRSPYHPYRLLRADDPLVNQRRELQAVTAACILMRPRWFHNCGGFDESYLNGYEDLDLCLQIRRAGGTIAYQPRSAVFHLESQTPGRMRHDNENRKRFFLRWSDTVLSDEDAFYFQDGYRIAEHRANRPELPRLVRLEAGDDRESWSTVALAQRHAAARRRDDLVALLRESHRWPYDTAIHRWAGVLAARLGLNEVARDHFQSALNAGDDIELRTYLSAAHPDLHAGNTSRRWENILKCGFDGLDRNDPNTAEAALETAMVRGAPARFVMPALARALRRCDPQQADAFDDALRLIPHPDPVTARHLDGSPLTGRPASTIPAAPAAPQSVVPVVPVEAAPTSVSIIILVLDQLEHTQRCLESLRRCTPIEHEIILVDNGSKPETAHWLIAYAKAQTDVRLIRNNSNRGFAAGNNQAIAIARGTHVILLNNDTVVTEGWLDRMMSALDRHPRAGIVGPRSNRVAGPQMIEHPGYSNLEELPDFARTWSARNAGKSRHVGRVIGFCLLARKSVIEAVGGLDERFGSGNFEDDDFCLRARLAGFESCIADDSFVHHVGSQTFQGARIDYRAAMQANWGLFKEKWGIPADTTLNGGYRLPSELRDGEPLRSALPNLRATHDASPDGKCWTDRIQPAQVSHETPAEADKPAKPGAILLPACALLGHLGPARGHLDQSHLREAWQATLQALEKRPFHPEALLLLSQIAEAAGDSAAAYQCAQHACALVPDWKTARRALKKIQRGGKPAKHGWLILPSSVKPQASPVPPRLSVCLIVRNEEQFLPRCLASIKPVAHQIVVLDTGSTDRTVEIAREFGAEVHRFEWCDDFAAARNACLEHATGDWILQLDADEELPPAEHSKLLAALQKEKVIGHRLPLLNSGLEAEGVSYVPRLFRNAPGLFYICRVHEQVFSSVLVRAEEWALETAHGGPQLLHHGYTKEIVRDRQKVQRNLRLLQQALVDFPDDANLLMNLGLELARSGDLAAALVQYEAAFRSLSSNHHASLVPELRETLLTQYGAHLIKALKDEDAIRILRSPLAKAGGLTASQQFALGLALMRTRRFADGAEAFRRCLATRNQPGLSPINPEILRAGPHHCLATCLANLGQPESALQSLENALRDDPKSRAVRMDLARTLFAQGRPIDALKHLHDIVAQTPADADAWRLGGDIALSRPDFLEFAVDWTGEAVKNLTSDPGLANQRGEALLRSGNAEGALPFWQIAAAHGGNSQRAAFCLCSVAAGQLPPPIEPDAESAVSREFLKLYQRLITTPGGPLLLKINANLRAVASALPSAAQQIESAMSEAA